MLRRIWTIRKCLTEESNSGWIWGPEFKGLESRDYIKLVNLSIENRIVYCVYRKLEDDYKRTYENRIKSNNNKFKSLDIENTLIISEYYRDKLKIELGEHELEIERIPNTHIIYKIRAMTMHPDNTVRIAVWLALISITIGTVSIIISLLNIKISLLYGLVSIAI